jgi:hypothetical protein
MAKGQKRSNREQKKPKQPKSDKKTGVQTILASPPNPLTSKRRP